MKLWGGNYETSPDAAFWEFNRSFPFDRRLLVEEVAASRAWVRGLGSKTHLDGLRDGISSARDARDEEDDAMDAERDEKRKPEAQPPFHMCTADALTYSFTATPVTTENGGMG